MTPSAPAVSGTAADPDAELRALIERIAQRDEAALRTLYERTSPRRFGLAMRVLRQRDTAEDVLQESFLTVWRVAVDYRASLSPPLAWLGLIVRSRALDALRKRASSRTGVTQEYDDAMEHGTEGEGNGPLDAADASQQAQALHLCLSRLEARQREVVSLAYLRDLSHSELAQQLAIPLGTVKTWVRRGLEQLRGCMARFA